MRIALAQINPVVGDLSGNREVILGRLEEAKAANADLVLFPELAVTGYPPEDLLLRPGFVRAAGRSRTTGSSTSSATSRPAATSCCSSTARR
jgi:predicted amidohydrolase